MLATEPVFPMIAVKSLEKARSFYEGVLGLEEITPKTESHVAVYQSAGGKLAVYVSEFAGTNRATAATWEVPDVEGEVKALRARGVAFEHYDMPGTTRKGDVHEGGGMKNAWFKDPEGNILGIVNRRKAG
jgi:catechol 2,3-dioxygenase-like lactoylglutathione lyase family enzyme